MKRKIIFIIFSGIIFSSLSYTSCKKDKVSSQSYDTIFPSPYLPVYPGSYWQYLRFYDDGSTGSDTITYCTSDNYKLCHNPEENEDLNSKYIYVPVWNDSAIMGYSWVKNIGNKTFEKINILSETLGESWIGPNNRVRTIETVSHSMTFNNVTLNNIIVAKEEVSNHPESQIFRYYFARDIGLICFCTYHIYYSEPSSTFYYWNVKYCLVDYHINQ